MIKRTALKPALRTPLELTSRIFLLTVASVLIGLASAMAAIVFLALVETLNTLLLVSPRSRVQFVGHPLLLALATLLVPAMAGVVVGFIFSRLSRQKRSLGPPDVVHAVQLHKRLPDLRSGIASTMAAILSLGAGASVGQYGPLVYLGAMFGDAMQRLNLRIPGFGSIATACGVSAAIATAFNAPIAGIVFAHEVILRHYSLRALAPTTVASATGHFVANYLFDRTPLFLVEYQSHEHGYEFLLFAILGIGAALVAVAFMNMVLAAARAAARMRFPAPVLTGGAGLVVGITALWLPDVLGTGTQVLRFAKIEGAFTLIELPTLIVAKLLLTAICIGFGFGGGVFSPSLLIGILTGATYWSLIDAVGVLPNSGVVAYAICGMSAVASAVIGAPLTMILIVFELTRNYDLTVAAMVGVVFSNLVAQRLFGKSLFDVQLRSRGFDIARGRDFAILSSELIIGRMVSDFPQATGSETAENVAARMEPGPWTEAFITSQDGQFLGKLLLSDARMNPGKTAAQLAIPPQLNFCETTTVMQAMELVSDFVGDAVPLITPDGKFLGAVTEAAIITAYLDCEKKMREEENAAL